MTCCALELWERARWLQEKVSKGRTASLRTLKPSRQQQQEPMDTSMLSDDVKRRVAEAAESVRRKLRDEGVLEKLEKELSDVLGSPRPSKHGRELKGILKDPRVAREGPVGMTRTQSEKHVDRFEAVSSSLKGHELARERETRPCSAEVRSRKVSSASCESVHSEKQAGLESSVGTLGSDRLELAQGRDCHLMGQRFFVWHLESSSCEVSTNGARPGDELREDPDDGTSVLEVSGDRTDRGPPSIHGDGSES